MKKLAATILIFSIVILLQTKINQSKKHKTKISKKTMTNTTSKTATIAADKIDHSKSIQRAKTIKTTTNFTAKSPNTPLEKKAFHYYNSLNSIEFHKTKNKFFEDTLNSNNVFNNAKKLLTDINYQSSLPDNKQAVMRVFYLDVIDYAAKNGYFTQVEHILYKSIENFDKGKSYPGQKEDLTDLMSSWLTALGEYKIVTCLECVLSRIKYHNQLKNIIATAIRYSFPHLLNDSKFIKNFEDKTREYSS